MVGMLEMRRWGNGRVEEEYGWGEMAESGVHREGFIRRAR